MSTYIADFNYILHTSARVTHKLVVIEKDYSIKNHCAYLQIYIERKNSGREHDANSQNIQLKINNEVVSVRHSGTPVLPENGSDIVELSASRNKEYFEVNYDADGTKNVKIELTYKSEQVNLVLDSLWGTIATSELSFDLPPIDMSLPSISNISVTADRYGLNASASFVAKHASYELYEVIFKLSGLTYIQANHRYGTHANGYEQGTFANNQEYGSNADGTYWVAVKLVYPINQSISVDFDLDDRPCSPPYALDSGGSYPWELTVTALNGKTVKKTGTLKVPQKVTGFNCESRLDMMPGESVALGYQIQPNNAEEQTVNFDSTNKNVAIVDGQGVVTAVGEGSCQIIATTVDGGAPDAPGFSAQCSVSVLNTEIFPTLTEIRYLTDREIIKISAACKFLYEKLVEKGVSVPTLSIVACEGKNHPVKEILAVLETINSNCIILKNATDRIYPTEHLSEQRNFLKQNIGKNWYRLVNEWVYFLNELYEKL